MKPSIGDVVLFEGQKYVVTEVGLKYVRMHPEDNPKQIHIAKVTQVSKWFPPSESEDEDDPFELPRD